ncbi:unnamed protein product [Spirodela intermedia]|uniref:Uncharacterized protein n=1 Tax=Spirodela intermedia TaxID=51605 RepID=A0A7I8ICW0_SPIIN|nr:unnamed protein product [Spirodela intermedia]CAA6655596.1 unnamed protein product [Spirodela intermedia]
MAVGSILLALISAGIYIFLISPAAKRRQLEVSGLRGPVPEFPLGNISEMRKESRAPAPPTGQSMITHDIHSAVFPFFSRWRESYGKVFVYWMGTESFLYVADPDFLSKMTAATTENSWGKPTCSGKTGDPCLEREW